MHNPIRSLTVIFLSTVSFSLFSAEEPTLSQNTKEVMESPSETPVYLYKILSFRNWQATQNRRVVVLSAEDNAFIHLSTEGQLDKIIAKYWAEESKFVILKLAVDKLQGDLRLESNPGGSTKYYHLYQGLIPYDSINEVKIIDREPIQNTSEPAPKLVQIGDPVLRKPARELTKEEILSPEIQQLIVRMKEDMRAAPGVGLAAPQIGYPLSIAVIEDMDLSHLTPEELSERGRSPVPFHVVINPKTTVVEPDTADFFEGCLSIHGLVGIVPRAKAIRVDCLNERAEPVVIHAKGWHARILQHEIDHLHGILFIDRAKLQTLMTSENYTRLWKGKSVQEILQALIPAKKSSL